MPAKRQLPAHGTTARYRRDCRCEKCKSANTRAKRQQRARARNRGNDPLLRIVSDTQTEPQTEPSTKTNSGTTKGSGDDAARQGPMYRAVTSDLADVNADDRPFFNVLRAAALTLARELDDLDSRSSKAPLVKQLVDVVRELKGKAGPKDDPLHTLFDDLGVDASGIPAAADRDDT